MTHDLRCECCFSPSQDWHETHKDVRHRRIQRPVLGFMARISLTETASTARSISSPKRDYQRGEQTKAAPRYHSALFRTRNATIIKLSDPRSVGPIQPLNNGADIG